MYNLTHNTTTLRNCHLSWKGQQNGKMDSTVLVRFLNDKGLIILVVEIHIDAIQEN